MHVHHHPGLAVAGDDCRTVRPGCLAELGQGAGGGGQIGLQADLVGDAHELLLLLEHGEEIAQILVGVHATSLVSGIAQAARRAAI